MPALIEPQSPLVSDGKGNFYGTAPFGGADGNNGGVFKITADGVYSDLPFFPIIPNRGVYPMAGLVRSSDGTLYGTTLFGGVPKPNPPGQTISLTGEGTIFKISGGTFTTLVDFGTVEGSLPWANLVVGSDGNLYGTTTTNENEVATIFRMTPGGQLTTLARLPGLTIRQPLVEMPNGDFYGVGEAAESRIFRLKPDLTLTTEHIFTGALPPNTSRYVTLTLAADGNLYGTVAEEGVFKLSPAGAFSMLAEFAPTDEGVGTSCWSPLCRATDGNLYGMTSSGGNTGGGTLFKVAIPSGALEVMNALPLETGTSRDGLVEGPDGAFYATCHTPWGNTSGYILKIVRGGPTNVLHQFQSIEGVNPAGGVTPGGPGEFFSTTQAGGSGGFGTVMKLDAKGQWTTLTSFGGNIGSTPCAGLTKGDDGNYYGTTSKGGTSDYGTIFRVTPEGAMTTLWQFNFNNGSNPMAALTKGADGNFYGTTQNGGSSNLGTIFQITPAGAFKTLFHFGGPDGRKPMAALVEDAPGEFYGTTSEGGNSSKGNVFKMTWNGTTASLTTLAQFGGAVAGSRPVARLTKGGSGVFYGTTSEGGTANVGTIFQVTTTGTLSTLYHFDTAHGSHPLAGLTQGVDGDFYGTTERGGTADVGTVFKMTPAGVVTTLVHLSESMGMAPSGDLVMAEDKHLYGTTPYGGTASGGRAGAAGQIFRLRFGPTLSTVDPSDIGTISATLAGTVNSNGTLTQCQFQLGTDPQLTTFSTIAGGTSPADNTSRIIQAPTGALTPGATYYYRIVATNADNPLPQTGDITRFTTLTLAEAWRKSNFSDPGSPLAAMNADADGDGESNLTEYAFGTNPMAATPLHAGENAGTLISRGVPSVRKKSIGGCEIVFVRRKDRETTGLHYAPQFSSDLADWTDSDATPAVIAADAEMEAVSVDFPTQLPNGQPARFFRIKITLP